MKQKLKKIILTIIIFLLFLPLMTIKSEAATKKVFFIGDSRTYHMITYYPNAQGYFAGNIVNQGDITNLKYSGTSYDNWFSSGGSMTSEVNKLKNVAAGTNVIIWLGVNDMANTIHGSPTDKAELYVKAIKKLATNYPNLVFCQISVTAVNEAKAKQYYSSLLTNARIDEFNNALSSKISAAGLSNYKYYDINSEVKSYITQTNSSYTGDGLHYTEAMYTRISNRIYSKVIDNLVVGITRSNKSGSHYYNSSTKSYYDGYTGTFNNLTFGAESGSTKCSLNDIVDAVNQCDSLGNFNFGSNTANVKQFFDKNYSDMVGKYIKYGPPNLWYEIGVNAGCWHFQKANALSGSDYYRKIYGILDIKANDVLLNGKSLKSLDSSLNVDAVRKLMYYYCSNINQNQLYNLGSRTPQAQLALKRGIYEYIASKYYDKFSGNAQKALSILYAGYQSGSQSWGIKGNDWKNFEYRFMITSGGSSAVAQPVVVLAGKKIENTDTGKIRLIKRDDIFDSIMLDGAQFVLWSDANNGYVKSGVTKEDSSYKLSNNITYTSKKDDAYKFVTGDRGIKGYIDITDVPVGKYKLVEYSPPTNYLINEYKEVTYNVKKFQSNASTKYYLNYFYDTLFSFLQGETKYNVNYYLTGNASNGSSKTDKITASNYESFFDTIFTYNNKGYTESYNGTSQNLKVIYDKYTTSGGLSGSENKIAAQGYLARVLGRKNYSDPNYYVINKDIKTGSILGYYSRTIGYTVGSATTTNSNLYGRLRVFKSATSDPTERVAGAEYVLYDTVAKKYVKTKYNEEKKSYKVQWTGKEMQYYSTKTDAINSVSVKNNAITGCFTTNASGYIDIDLLNTEHTYDLIEVKAPPKYKLADDKKGIKVRSYARSQEYRLEYLRRVLEDIFNVSNSLNLTSTEKKNIAYALTGNKTLSISSKTRRGIIYEILFNRYSSEANYAKLKKALDDKDKDYVKNYIMTVYNRYRGTSRTIDHAQFDAYTVWSWGAASTVSSEPYNSLGGITIVKQDEEYPDLKLKGVVFIVQNKTIASGYDQSYKGYYLSKNGSGETPAGYSKTTPSAFTTNSDGKITLENLIPGTYTLNEVGVGPGINSKVYTNRSWTFTIKGGVKSEDLKIEIKNPHKYGAVQIKKIDDDTGETLKGIGFKLFIDGKWANLIDRGTYYEYNPSGSSTTYNAGTMIYTQDNGLTKPVYKIPLTAKVEVWELYIPNDLKGIYPLEKIGVPYTTPKEAKYCDVAEVQKITEDEIRNGEFSLTVKEVHEVKNSSTTDIVIQKVDAKTREPVPGVSFHIVDLDGNYGEAGRYLDTLSTPIKSSTTPIERITGSSGTINLGNLKPGKYKFIEVYILPPANKKYIVPESPDNETIFEVKTSNNIPCVIENSDGTTWLKLKKIDSETQAGINGIMFALKTVDGKYVYKDASGEYKYDGTGADISKSFVTTRTINGEAGMIEIDGLRAGNYIFTEISTTYNTDYIIPENPDTLVTVKEGEVNTITVTNRKTGTPVSGELKIKGKAWVDRPTFDSNKVENKINNVLGNEDIEFLNGIDVYLYDASGNVISSTTTDTTGNYTLEIDVEKIKQEAKQEAITAANNNQTVINLRNQIANLDTTSQGYQIAYQTLLNQYNTAYTNAYNYSYRESYKQKVINLISNYHVSFSYDGVKYQNVKLNQGSIDAGTSSLAAETTRDAFNKDFEVITGEDQQIKGEKVIYNTQVSDNIKIDNKYLIGARTDNSTLKDRFNNLSSRSDDIVTEITNINLGVYERAMPELAIYKDVFNATISVNGKSYTYWYDKKNRTEQTADTTVGVVFEKNIELLGGKYITPIYRADVEEKGPGKEKVEVMYKIGFINNSPELLGKINSIEEYFSSSYNYLGTYEGTSNTIGNKLNVQVTEKENTEDGFKHYTISGLNQAVGVKEAKYIYIKFEIIRGDEDDPSTDMLLRAIGYGDSEDSDSEEEDESYSKLENNVEISSYSSYSDNNKPYAGFDTNSIPNNYYREYDFHNSKNENDTDQAPGFKIVEGTERRISGNVFEDKVIESKLEESNERLGDGIYNAAEDTKITGVKVQLVEIDSDGKDKEGGKNYEVETDDDGYYQIAKFIPGDYKLKYIWGDETYTPGKYKSTILHKDYVSKMNSITDNKDARWYQKENQEGTRYSEAVDIAAERVEIDKNASNEIYEDMEFMLDDVDPQAATITAETEKLNIVVDLMGKNYDEYKEDDGGYRIYYYNIENIDFGIVERPHQSMKVTKDLSYIKIVTGNQTLVESEIVDGKLSNPNVNYAVYLPKSPSNQYGAVKVELDNSLFPIKVYAKYKVSVENTSEEDYYRDNELSNYYIYGEVKAPDKRVELKPTGVYDYISEKFDIQSVKLEDGTDAQYDIFKKEAYGKDNIDEMITIERDEYVDDGHGNPVPTGNKIKVSQTVIEKAYNSLVRYLENNEEGITTIDEYTWSTEQQIEEVFADWCYKTGSTETTTVRDKKLSGNEIIQLKSLSDSPMTAGQTKSVTIDALAEVASAADEITLQNDAEIINVDRTSKFGKTPFRTYQTLYDRGEKIIITPPTGENRDKSDMVLIVSTAIGAITLLGIGIILIKKKVLDV